MARRLVTVSDTGQLPPEVLAKIGETYISRIEAGTIIDTRVQFAIDNLTSDTPAANKIPRYDENGMLTVNDGVESGQPVNLGQLDERIPADGIPLATQLQAGLMSVADKTKLDSTLPRKPFPWGTKFKDLETGVVYYYHSDTLPEGADISEFPDFGGVNLGFEILVSIYEVSGYIIRQYSLTTVTTVLGMKKAGTTTLSTDPIPDLSPNSWHDAWLDLQGADRLKNATSGALGHTLVVRDGNGRFSVADPTSDGHVATKRYVSDASNLLVGTVPAGRLPLATVLVNGAMTAAHYSLLNGSTYLPNASTLVRRDSAGRHQVSDPFSVTDAANKRYVDTAVSNAIAPTTWIAALLAAGQTAASENVPQYRRNNDRVEFRGMVVYSGSGAITGSLPASSPQVRPGVGIPVALLVSTTVHGTGAKLVAAQVNSLGSLAFVNPSEVPAGSYVSLNSIHWII